MNTNQPSIDDPKHVQTELTPEEYDSFRRMARERGLSVKAAVREAIVDWVDRHRQPDPNDRAFTVLDELNEPGDGLAATDAVAEDDLVEEWSGDDVSVRLLDAPPTDP